MESYGSIGIVLDACPLHQLAIRRGVAMSQTTPSVFRFTHWTFI